MTVARFQLSFEAVCGTLGDIRATLIIAFSQRVWPEKYAVAWDLGFCYCLKVGNGRDESREEVSVKGSMLLFSC